MLILRYPDTPCISQTLSVTFSESNTHSVVDAISSLGELSMTGTLQIAELMEHPGAILVQWYDEVRLPISDTCTVASTALLPQLALFLSLPHVHCQSFRGHKRIYYLCGGWVMG